MIGDLYDFAIRTGLPVEIEYADGSVVPLPVAQWSGGLLPGDETMVERASGATLDVGCGPGRLAAGVAARGLPALGIDIAPAAVERTQQRGALALLRDVFDAVPGQGRWDTILLADGNVGIGSDPGRLLGRVRELLAPAGSAVVEVASTPHARGQCAVRLRASGGPSGPWFRWAEVGTADLPAVATSAGFVVVDRWSAADRAFAELRRSAA